MVKGFSFIIEKVWKMFFENVWEPCTHVNLLGVCYVLHEFSSCLCFSHVFLTAAHLAWNKGVYRGRAAFDITFLHKTTFSLNTLRAGLIQAARKKQLIQTWLCG